MTTYEWTEEMGEISGFGEDLPSYENACRAMVIAGAHYLDQHPIFKPLLAEFRGVMGLVEAENEAGERLVNHMLQTVQDEFGESPTGAMVHVAVRHVAYIEEHGWDKYVKKMETEREDEP